MNCFGVFFWNLFAPPLRRHWKSLLLICALGAMGGGCTVARMALPPEMSSGQWTTWSVTGRQGFQLGTDLTFGPYRLADVRRGWTTRESLALDIFKMARADRKFRFTLVTVGTHPQLVTCQSRARWNELDIESRQWQLQWGLSSEKFTSATFHRGGQGYSLLMTADNADGFLLSGSLIGGSRRWDIRPTRRLDGAAWDVLEDVGYFISEDGHLIAAVETINDGAVYVRPGLSNESRDLVATVAGVLLLDRKLIR